MAIDRSATPADYVAAVAALKPGDLLRLEPGIYRGGLHLHDLHGSAQAPITIEGPREAPPAVFTGELGRNTVSLKRASHLVIRNLVLDGMNLPVDAVKAERSDDVVHHIVLEALTIIRHGSDQQDVGISTKAPAAFWTIRNNVIVGAGTGMYLGSQDGSVPFVAGVIEGNVISDTLGYNLEIKPQGPRPALVELPLATQRTSIRGNVFSKAANANGGELARPNLFLGHLPPSGPGRDDRYLVEDNVFLSNPVEALVQDEGNMMLRHNLLFNESGPAIVIRSSSGEIRQLAVRDNFIASAGRSIEVDGKDARESSRIAGNEVVHVSGGDRAGQKGETPTTTDSGIALRRWLASRSQGAGSDVLREVLRKVCAEGGGTSPAAGVRLPSGHVICRALASR